MVVKTQQPNPSHLAFQQLKVRLHRQMVDAIDFSKAAELPEQDLRLQLCALANHLCEQQAIGMPAGDREMMVKEILDEIYGFGPLEPLISDPDVSDVLVNRPDRVLVECDGVLRSTDIRFADEAHLLRLIQRLISRAGRRIDEHAPMVDAMLPEGLRLHAVIPPLAARGPTLSIRRIRSRPLSLADMVRQGTLAPEMADFLAHAVRGRLNILLSGGTGAGTTTLLNSLGSFIPVSQRIVSIEQTAELQLQQPDVIALEAWPIHVEGRGEISPRELLKSSLRMRPDRILVGDVLGGEILELLQAMQAGHEGSVATVHANDARDALNRLELMLALSGVDLPTSIARQYIASAIQVLVHIARLASGERKIMRISELHPGKDGAYRIEDIFVYRMIGIDDSLRAQGVFYATGYQPVTLNRLAATSFDVPTHLFQPRELSGSADDWRPVD